ncbi:SulP family inorganic anion transporter [Poriferisphaera sp. WC338]|uniref:SulP family inorganic anion transporter n=1 Tax=Poriferisphaera sp. WC338 TaxID=3425129 RepID=UPI003D817EA3
MPQTQTSVRSIAHSLADPFMSPLGRFRDTIRNYNLAALRADTLAGLTVSFVAVPQAMAYALIAGVPAQYGLYTVIIQCLIGTVFGAHPLLSPGPINTQSLLTASIVGTLAPGQPDLFLSLVISLTLIKGVVQILMSEARLGQLVKFVSTPVIIGFTAGAAILIASGQINNFLGFSVVRSPENWPGVVGIGQRLLPHLASISMYAVGIGVFTLGVVLVCRRISRMIPGPLIGVLASAAIVFFFQFTSEHLTLFSAIPAALPTFNTPRISMDVIDKLMVGATALAVLGMLEAYSIGRAITAKRGGQISANDELFSQGLINFVSSFFESIPGSGSFSRSALNEYAGARTSLAGLANAVFVILIVLLIKGLVPYIPKTAIAAVLFVVAYGLIDFKFITKLYRANRFDLVVCITTLLATLFLPLAYAVFVGIMINIALYLRQTARLRMHEIVHVSSTGSFHEKPFEEDNLSCKDMVFVQLDGDLYFALADELQIRLSETGRSAARVVILRLKRTHSIDSSALHVIEQFVKSMQSQNKHVILTGVQPEMKQTLDRYGITQLAGEQNVFLASNQTFNASHRAVQHAQVLICGDQQEMAEAGSRMSVGWSYSI